MQVSPRLLCPPMAADSCAGCSTPDPMSRPPLNRLFGKAIHRSSVSPACLPVFALAALLAIVPATRADANPLGATLVPGFSSRVWTTREGLPQNLIRTVVQTGTATSGSAPRTPVWSDSTVSPSPRSISPTRQGFRRTGSRRSMKHPMARCGSVPATASPGITAALHLLHAGTRSGAEPGTGDSCRPRRRTVGRERRLMSCGVTVSAGCRFLSVTRRSDGPSRSHRPIGSLRPRTDRMANREAADMDDAGRPSRRSG